MYSTLKRLFQLFSYNEFLLPIVVVCKTIKIIVLYVLLCRTIYTLTVIIVHPPSSSYYNTNRNKTAADALCLSPYTRSFFFSTELSTFMLYFCIFVVVQKTYKKKFFFRVHALVLAMFTIKITKNKWNKQQKFHLTYKTHNQ